MVVVMFLKGAMDNINGHCFSPLIVTHSTLLIVSYIRPVQPILHWIFPHQIQAIYQSAIAHVQSIKGGVFSPKFPEYPSSIPLSLMESLAYLEAIFHYFHVSSFPVFPHMFPEETPDVRSLIHCRSRTSLNIRSQTSGTLPKSTLIGPLWERCLSLV